MCITCYVNVDDLMAARAQHTQTKADKTKTWDKWKATKDRSHKTFSMDINGEWGRVQQSTKKARLFELVSHSVTQNF